MGQRSFFFDCLHKISLLKKKYILHPRLVFLWPIRPRLSFCWSGRLSYSGTRESICNKALYTSYIVDSIHPVLRRRRRRRRRGRERWETKMEKRSWVTSPRLSLSLALFWTRGQVEGPKPAAFLCYPQLWKKKRRETERRDGRGARETKDKQKEGRKRKDIKTKQKGRRRRRRKKKITLRLLC